MSRRSLASRLRDDRRGVALLEFALITPVFLMLLMGACDLAHRLYMQSSLQGVVQKAARDSSLESGTDAEIQAKLDQRVTNAVTSLAKSAKVTITRRFYRTFVEAEAADPESWTDTNKNKTCDAKEPYQDENNNGVWDADGGDSGQGTAKDRTVYTVSATFPHLFPFWRLLGGTASYELAARTVLENQPYSDQQSYAKPTVRNCP